MQEILLVSQRETNVLWKIPGGKEGITGTLHLHGQIWPKSDMRKGSRMAPSHSRSSPGQVSVAEWAFQMENGRRGSWDGKRGFGLSPTREWLHPQMSLPSLTLKLRSLQQKLSSGTQKNLHPQPREGGRFSEIQKEKAGFQERQTDKESLIDSKRSDRKGDKHPMAFNIQTEKENFTPRKP